MVIDDYNTRDDDDDPGAFLPTMKDFTPLEKEPFFEGDDHRHYLTTDEFNYTMKILDDKINSIYKFCKFFGNEQQKQAKSLEKLVALDDLSDAF